MEQDRVRGRSASQICENPIADWGLLSAAGGDAQVHGLRRSGTKLCKEGLDRRRDQFG